MTLPRLLSSHPQGTCVILDVEGRLIATVDAQRVRRDVKGRIVEPEPSRRHALPSPRYGTRAKVAPRAWHRDA